MRGVAWKAGVAVSLLAAGTVRAADWAQWRGPARDGRLVGFRAPAQWPPQLAQKWAVKVGEGHGSPIIAGERAYLLTREGEQEVTRCVALATGKTVWEDRVDAPFDSVIFPARRLGKSPRSTPLYQDGRLYTVGVNSLLTCFDAATGKVLWRKEFRSRFPVPTPVCGASLSPLIVGERLFVHVGHEEKGAFLALDRKTGRELWSWEGEGPGYTSPILATLEGVPQLVTATHNLWIGLDPETGRLLWSVRDRQNMFNHNSVTPVVRGDLVICGGNLRSTYALRVRKSGPGWQVEKAWETREVTLSTTSPLLAADCVYVLNEKRRGQLAALDPATGKVLWSDSGDQGEHATLYQTGDYVLQFRMTGDLKVLRKNGPALSPVASYDLADSATWASPALSGNRVLVKGAETLSLWIVP